MRTRFCESIFWGKGFRKTSANIFLNSAGLNFARRRGLGRNAGNSKYKILGASVHHIIVSSLKGIHPRHPPREFPLGLRAPVLGMGTAQIPGNEPFPFLVGERILLSPVRCLGSCSFQSHPAERDRAHPTRPHKPLSGFSCPRLWCRFRY